MAKGGQPLRLFVAVKGHPFSRDVFEAMLYALGGVEPTMVAQPAAALLLNPDAMRRFDAILLYDMPGLDFSVPKPERPALVDPDPGFKAGFRALLEEGKGIIAVHHAIAGWPAWPQYAEALGGVFLYKPAIVRGRNCLESYYVDNVAYYVRLASTPHPVIEGMPHKFDFFDELYLSEIFEDDVVPLIYRDSSVRPEQYESAMQAVQGTRDFNPVESVPQKSTNLLGWAKAAGASPLVYFQPGDSPNTYANPYFRLLLSNAIRWVASADAQRWVGHRIRAQNILSDVSTTGTN